MANSKKAVLVVGPPRSGTSVVANVISKLDVYFGDPIRFIDPEQQKHNPIFFELSSLNQINDTIFKYFSKNWADFDWMPDRPDFSEIVCSKFEPTISEFIQNEFGSSKNIGLKDPRFCYTLPLWESVLTKMGFDLIYILVRRLSASVFKSNKAVNGLSASTNFRLVAQSNILAARFVQSKPFIQIHYENLLRDPETSIRAICGKADLPFDRIKDASSVLHKRLQHHNDSEKTLYKYFSDVIDANEIDPVEYDKYREINLTSTYEKNELIEKLALELTDKEQGVMDFPYRRETMQMFVYLWRAIRYIIPRYSQRERFVKLVLHGTKRFIGRQNDQSG